MNLHVGGLQRSSDDVVGVTRQYLAAMRREIASPEIHLPANVTTAWAVPASEAWTIDPCIPRRTVTGAVWVTRCVGDYLNLHDFPWSTHFGQFDEGFDLACRGAAPSGTMVIDDTTGEILGVFPGEHGGLVPTPRSTSEGRFGVGMIFGVVQATGRDAG